MLPGLIAVSPDFMIAEGTPSAYVASHRDITAITRNFRNFSGVKPVGLPGMERFDMFNGQPVMNYSDPPEHTRRGRGQGQGRDLQRGLPAADDRSPAGQSYEHRSQGLAPVLRNAPRHGDARPATARRGEAQGLSRCLGGRVGLLQPGDQGRPADAFARHAVDALRKRGDRDQRQDDRRRHAGTFYGRRQITTRRCSPTLIGSTSIGPI